MQRSILSAIVLSIAAAWQIVSVARAQEPQMRSRSVWSGQDFGPRQTWPGAPGWVPSQQQFYQQGRTQSGQFTPQSVLSDQQSKIQQALSRGDLEATANGYESLAQQLIFGGMSSYAPGSNGWDFYKKAVVIRLQRIKDAYQRGDTATERAQWQKLQTDAQQLNVHEPAEPEWCYLEGMSYFRTGSDFNGYAKDWLGKCASMPNCTPKMQQACANTLAEIKKEEIQLANQQLEESYRNSLKPVPFTPIRTSGPRMWGGRPLQAPFFDISGHPTYQEGFNH